MYHRCWRGLAALVGAVIWNAPAIAQWSISLPVFSPCSPATTPDLPIRWRAVGLMTPFSKGQLDIGEFVYDGTLPAMRATVYGLESGAVDLLITDQDTYVLSGSHASPSQCTSLGPKLHSPSQQWLSSQAVCFGQAPVASKVLQWWQTPRSDADATWYWFSTETHLPWRSLFLKRSLDPAVIGDYAMTYFPIFTPLPTTNLSALRDLCAKHPVHGDTQTDTAAPTARELMTAIPNPQAEAERSLRIGELIPGLRRDGCSRVTPPRWPDRYVMTAVLTPIRFNEGPYSAMIYYDWSQAHSQVILLFQGRSPVLKDFISLRRRVGYRIGLPSFSGPACEAAFPGMNRPDWMTVASCECQGTIDHNAALSPNAEIQILACPIKSQGDRRMFAWYTTEGRPITFMEAGAQGPSVMLADYDDWLPGQTAQSDILELPRACNQPEGLAGTPGSGLSTFFNLSCSDCHTR
jgi:hypothetical protein